MSRTMEQLIASLDKANEIYTELIQLAKEKRELIKEQKIEDLERLTSREMGLVGALYKLEDIRAKIVDRLIEERGIPQIKTISELADHLPAAERSRVIDAKNQLLVGIHTISEETKFNARILEEKIQLIDLNLQLLADAGEPEGNYGSDGKRKSIFDARI
ncbi:MAG: flagellar protein FlgN [Bacillota bacterium]|nr:flagellar protein FlgN [Bacillota bacterium]